MSEFVMSANTTARIKAQQYYAARANAQALQQRQSTENLLKQHEQLLGSDAQMGYTGPTQELIPYLGRYQAEQGGLESVGAYDKKHKNLYSDALNLNLTSANNILAQAEAAARAGNFDEAARLKAQADTTLTDLGPKKNRFGPGVANAEQLKMLFNYVGPDDTTLANAQLQSPMARLAGQTVKDARDFQDWNSEASIRQRRLLTEGGERSLASGEREGLRSARMERMQAGGMGIQAGQARVLDERQREGYATERAQLRSQADSQFSTWSRQYAENATGFANAFLQNQAGIRDQYQAAIENLKAGLSQMSSGFANQYQQMGMQGLSLGANADAADTQFKRELMTALVSIGAGAAADKWTGRKVPNTTTTPSTSTSFWGY